ncbi:MAG TPA: type IX secretion system outer membrane channel protein PorV [Bacteroidota bacterium]|nr:type IX secretion system outer membrane channel protein PorV [Bacteroidota bacterium]
MVSHRFSQMLKGLLIISVITGAFLPSAAQAQGESAVPFLLIAPNARADAMGEAGVALANDAAANFWNPAGLAFQIGQEVSLTHSAWLPAFQQSDLFYDYVAYRNYIADVDGTFGASITYLSLGEFSETTADGPEVVSTFRAFEMAATMGYATRVTDDLGVGVNLRYIHSSLAPFNVQGQDRKGVASTVSFDVGALWRPRNLGEIGNMFNLGLNLSNLGPKLTYIDAAQADPLPTQLRLGLAVDVLKSQFNNVTAIVDFSRILIRRYPAPVNDQGIPIGDPPPPDNVMKALFSSWKDGGLKKVTIGTGVEYWYGDPKLISLRFGYFYEHPDYGNRKFLTFGAGVRYDIYGFDFSYLSTVEENHPLSETLRFTLLIAWGV